MVALRRVAPLRLSCADPCQNRLIESMPSSSCARVDFMSSSTAATTRSRPRHVHRRRGGAPYVQKALLVGVVGGDWREEDTHLLAGRGICSQGVESSAEGKTFRRGGRYGADWNTPHDVTELNVLETFEPKLLDAYRDLRFVFLANAHPQVQMQGLEQVESPVFAVADTMNPWIDVAWPDPRRAAAQDRRPDPRARASLPLAARVARTARAARRRAGASAWRRSARQEELATGRGAARRRPALLRAEAPSRAPRRAPLGRRRGRRRVLLREGWRGGVRRGVVGVGGGGLRFWWSRRSPKEDGQVGEGEEEAARVGLRARRARG